MLNNEIPFKFKEKRNYIHGPDLFNETVKVFGLESVSHINLAFHELVTADVGTIHISENLSEIKSLSLPQVSGCLMKDQTKYWLAYTFSDKTSSESLRVEYDESLVTDSCQIINDEVVFNALSPYSFMETIVAMKKFLLENRYPDAQGKAIISKVAFSKIPMNYKKIQISIIQNLYNKLVRSKVTVDDVDLGELFFSYKVE